ncbi:MAG: choice-of-anchor D domain-containing protein [Bradymonadaceae bacterium]|nr:choice-of-anchor D domain-containing protein [Lujinxingiaceae bacterium]
MKAVSKMGALALLVSGVVASLGAPGCGDNDSFTAVAVPGFTIEDLSSAGFVLDISQATDRHVTQSPTVILRSSDKAELTISKLEWVARPDRLVIAGARSETSCDPSNGDADCSGGAICLAVANSKCLGTGLEAPFSIAPGLQHQIQFIVKQGSGQLECPQAGASVPAEYKERYCGELLIETNAQNNSGIVQGGKARLYFLTDGNSGEIKLEPQFVQFANAQAGVSQTANFTIRNSASGPLTVFQADIHPNSEMFSISPAIPPSQPVIIAGNEAQSFTLTFNPPGNATDAALEFSSTISFVSSSIGITSPKIILEVTRDAGNAPRIVIEPDSLEFSSATQQIITVSNFGKATGQLTGLTLRPQGARPFYKVLWNGVDILANFPTQRPTLPRATEVDGEIVPSSIELVVEFEAPAESNVSTIGELEIRHNDTFSGNKTLVDLFGDEGEAAIGQVAPFQFTFPAGQTNQERRFVVHNRGSDPLIITDVVVEPGLGTTGEEFAVSTLTGTIAPGGLLEGTATYSSAVNVRRSVAVRLVSNSVGSQDDMVLALVGQPVAANPTLAVDINPSFTTAAKVGENTTFTAVESSGTGNLAGSNWVLLSRPASSSAFFTGTGASVSFVPDAAGTYRLSVIVPNGENVDAQKIFEFTAAN